ncbi:MAG: hypothetical protein QOF25_2089, partial [Mycobacterium sp.]|nr:hypothetical protein [Mycobacterium sp.]
MKYPLMTVLLVAAAALAGCGGGVNSNAAPTPPKLLTNIA